MKEGLPEQYTKEDVLEALREHPDLSAGEWREKGISLHRGGNLSLNTVKREMDNKWKKFESRTPLDY